MFKTQASSQTGPGTYFCNVVARSTVIFAFVGKAPGDSGALSAALSELFLREKGEPRLVH